MSRKKGPPVGDYPSHLRGLATNRHGGNQPQRERSLKGGTYGPAGAVHVYTEDERKVHERKLRDEGGLE